MLAFEFFRLEIAKCIRTIVQENVDAQDNGNLQLAREAFEIYQDNSKIFVLALEYIYAENYAHALDVLVEAKHKEMMWVNGWINRRDVSNAVPRPDGVARMG